MKIGEIVISDGMKRQVVGLCMAEGTEYPVTVPYSEEKEDFNGEGEVESKEDAESVKEDGESKGIGVTMQYLCKWCNRNCKSPVGLQAHERACKKNPESKNFKI